MSKYTITLRNIEEFIGKEKLISFFTDYETSDFLTQEQIEVIENSGIWSKEKLAKKIINHYYMSEIGFETIERFRIECKSFLNEIMESKLPLIYSNSIQYDPLVNVDFTETFDRNIDGTSTNSGTSNVNGTSNSTSENEGNTFTKNSVLPQSQLQNLKDSKYVSNAQDTETHNNISDTTNNETSSSSESNSNVTNIEHYTRKQKGNSGSLSTAQRLIMQYRENIVNIDKDIIEEISILFMRNILKGGFLYE